MPGFEEGAEQLLKPGLRLPGLAGSARDLPHYTCSMQSSAECGMARQRKYVLLLLRPEVDLVENSDIETC